MSVHRLYVHVNTHQAQRNGNHNTRKRRGRKVTPANDEGVELGSASARLSSNLSAFAFEVYKVRTPLTLHANVDAPTVWQHL